MWHTGCIPRCTLSEFLSSLVTYKTPIRLRLSKSTAPIKRPLIVYRTHYLLLALPMPLFFPPINACSLVSTNQFIRPYRYRVNDVYFAFLSRDSRIRIHLHLHASPGRSTISLVHSNFFGVVLFLLNRPASKFVHTVSNISLRKAIFHCNSTIPTILKNVELHKDPLHKSLLY